MRTPLAFATLALAAASAAAQSPTAALHRQVAARYSGDSAFQTVAYLDQYVRWPGNRGFDASIAHIVQRLEAAGYVAEASARATDRLVFRVERYPMAAPAWEPRDASVMLDGDSAPLLRFADLERDTDLIELAREVADTMLSERSHAVERHLDRWLGHRQFYLKA